MSYEITLWKDNFDTQGKLKEQKICLLASSEYRMVGGAYNLNYTRKKDGSSTFSFKLPKYYHEDLTGKTIESTFPSMIFSKSKIKAQKDDQWYTFVVNNIKEQKDKNGVFYEYTCGDLALEELSKSGYSLLFANEIELMSQYGRGTPQELMTRVLDEGTQWNFDNKVDQYFPEYTQKQEWEWDEDTYTNKYVDYKTPSAAYCGKYIPALDRFCYECNGEISVTTTSTVNSVTTTTISTFPVYNYDTTRFFNTTTVENLFVNGSNFKSTTGWAKATSATWEETLGIEISSEIDMSETRGPTIESDGHYLSITVPEVPDTPTGGAKMSSAWRIETTILNTPNNKLEGGKYYLFYFEGSPLNSYTDPENPASPVPPNYADAVVGAKIEIYNGNNLVTGPNTRAASIRGNKAAGAYTYFYIPDTIENPRIEICFDNFQYLDEDYSTIYIGGLYLVELVAYDVTDPEQREIDFHRYLLDHNTGSAFPLLWGRKALYPADSSSSTPQRQVCYIRLTSSDDPQSTIAVILPDAVPQSFSLNKSLFFYETVPDTLNEEELKYIRLNDFFVEPEIGTTYPADISNSPYIQVDENLITPIPTNNYYYATIGLYCNDFNGDQIANVNLVRKFSFNKTRTLQAEKSNRYTLIYDICELFRLFPKFTITYDNQGTIIDRKVGLSETVGQNTWNGFRYGRDTTSITRTLESEEIVTKMYVENSETEFALNGSGIVSIITAPGNDFKSNFIYNFRHYLNTNSLLSTQLETDMALVRNQLSNSSIRQDAANIIACNKSMTECETNIKNANAVIESLNRLKTEAATQMGIAVQSLRTEYQQKEAYYGQLIEEWSDTLNTLMLNKSIIQSNLNEAREDYKNELTTNKNTIDIFEKKYSIYLKEGTWSGGDAYLSDTEYYNDAVLVSNDSAIPKVTYSFDVVDLSVIPGNEYLKPEVGDMTFVIDEDLFGRDSTGKLIPEEVYISEILEVWDNPSQNKLTVSSYKTSFEEIFERITASMTTVEKNENLWNKISKVTEGYNLKKISVQEAITDNNNLTLNSQNNNWLLDSNGFIFTSMANANKKIKISGEGIYCSKNGTTWIPAITPDGIDGSYITSTINVNSAPISSLTTPTFRWDELGISKNSQSTINDVNYDSFVRFDGNGLYVVDDSARSEISGSNWTYGTRFFQYYTDPSSANNSTKTDKPWFYNETEENILNLIRAYSTISITKKGLCMTRLSEDEGLRLYNTVLNSEEIQLCRTIPNLAHPTFVQTDSATWQDIVDVANYWKTNGGW